MVNFTPLLAALSLDSIFNFGQSSLAVQKPLTKVPKVLGNGDSFTQRDAFMDALVANMTVSELGEFATCFLGP